MKGQSSTRGQRAARSDNARRLSRMVREDRLLSKAIARSRRRPKAGYRDCGKVQMKAHNLCPPEWR